MTPFRRTETEGAIAAVLGGPVTRERLAAAAGREGRDGSPLIRSLLAQSLPSIADLARVYAAGAGLRLDPSFLAASPKAARLVDPEVLRRERCVPVEIVDGVCVLAVEEGRAESAVRALRALLQREILPVLAAPDAIVRALDALPPLSRAPRSGVARRKTSPVHERFRRIVFEPVPLDALAAEGGP